VRLGHACAVVGDCAQAEGDDHGVEALIVELQCLSVAEPQVDFAPEFVGPLPADLKHPWAQLDRGQPNVGGVVGQVAARSERELEHIAGGLRADPLAAAGEQDPVGADPLAAAGEQDPVEEPHLPVVAGRLLS
jgi:hypothetical protein